MWHGTDTSGGGRHAVCGKYFPFTTFRRLIAHTRLTLSFFISQDALKGFSNKGLLTVACLFVVAAGISNTHALDYYMGKLLGHPKNAAQAQIRLMVPGTVSRVSQILTHCLP